MTKLEFLKHSRQFVSISYFRGVKNKLFGKNFVRENKFWGLFFCENKCLISMCKFWLYDILRASFCSNLAGQTRIFDSLSGKSTCRPECPGFKVRTRFFACQYLMKKKSEKSLESAGFQIEIVLNLVFFFWFLWCSFVSENYKYFLNNCPDSARIMNPIIIPDIFPDSVKIWPAIPKFRWIRKKWSSYYI